MRKSNVQILSMLLAIIMLIGIMPGFKTNVFAGNTTLVITFDANGGTPGEAWRDQVEQEAPYTDTVYAPPTSFCTPPSRCVFDGFEIGGKRYGVGEAFTLTEDTGVKFLWKFTRAIVYWDANGGMKGDGWKDKVELEVPFTDTVYAPPTSFWMPPLGCVFDGYEVDGKRYGPGETYTVTEDVCIKLLWKVMQCNVQWDANGGTPGEKWVASETLDAGTTIKLDRIGEDYVTPPEGKEFSHFEVNGEKVAKGEEIIISGPTSIVYCWKAKLFEDVQVSFDLNGGTKGPNFPKDPILVTYGMDYQFEPVTAEIVVAPRGMKFDAYEVDGVRYEVGDHYVFTKDTTIKYLWIKDGPMKLDIKYDANGGTKGSKWLDGFQIEEGKTLILSDLGEDFVTAPEGKEFDAYEIDGVRYELNSKYTFTKDVTIKFLWKDKTVTPEPQPVSPEPQPVSPEPSFADFVERLYTVALGRPSEEEGKAFWVHQVEKKGFTGADCARFFLLDAPEFLGRNLTDEQFVETLYQTFFGRESEPDGKAYWLGRLASGSPKADLVNDFIESVEWCNICATYGVKSGAVYHKATVPSKNAVKFATRLYTCCLGRDPEEDGLNYWALALTNLDATGYQAASLFFTLPEFVGLKTTNEEYLKRLYTTFMGREPEVEGYNYWLGMLNGGADRNDVMKAFAGCPEFQDICNQYGIERGEI